MARAIGKSSAQTPRLPWQATAPPARLPVPLPLGLPAWITEDAVADTLATLGPLYDDALAVDDVVELLQNGGRLFSVLSGDTGHERAQATTTQSNANKSAQR